MDEAWAVLSRLERIEALRRRGAAPAPLLQELRELAREAEAWARRERDGRALEAGEAVAEAIDPLSFHAHEPPLPCPLPAWPRPSDSTPTPARR